MLLAVWWAISLPAYFAQNIIPCSNRGSCQCFKGTSGQNCENNRKNVTPDYCSQFVTGFNSNLKLADLCNPNGKCRNEPTGAVCDCNSPFSGPTCQLKIDLTTTPTPTRRPPRSEKVLLLGSYWTALKATHTAEYFHPENPTKNFQSSALSSYGRTEHTAAIMENFILVAGGKDPTQLYALVPEMETYFPAQKRWAKAARTDYRRNLVSGAVLEGVFYICGGKDKWHRAVNFCTTWQIANNELVSGPKPPMMKVARMGHEAVAVDGKLFILGGYNPKGILNSVEFYSPKENKWTSVRSMLEARMDFGAAVLRDRIYACGGYGRDDLLRSCEGYHLRNRRWISQGPMEVARVGFCLVEFNGDLLALGGDFDASNSTEVFSKGKWRDSVKLLSPRTYFTALVL